MKNLELLGEGESYFNEICSLIEKTDFLFDLSPENIQSFAKWVKVYSAPMGTTIFEEGSEITNLCIIAEGEVDVFKETNPGEYLKIANIKAGGIIGEIGIIDGEALSASAIASTDSKILIITGEQFPALMSEDSELGIQLIWRIARIISSRLRKTTGLLTDFLKTEKNQAKGD